MRAITNCPACQTQFFVTEEQLNQHDGKVRCGHCLHVFDAKQQLVEQDSQAETDATTVNTVVSDESPVNLAPESIAENIETEAVTINVEAPINEPVVNNEASNQASITDYGPSHFDDFLDKTKRFNRLTKKSSLKSNLWLWLIFAIILFIIAIAQSVYFLRNEIAIYYPAAKPYLVKACEKIACTIELPKKIEFIIIDDSDIQEDAEHAGLMRLSSTLINQAGFSQAYPNLELTLTDVEDKPKLRRIFKPQEYLPEHIDITRGLAPGEEMKIKLAMTTQGETVAGYRVFVTY